MAFVDKYVTMTLIFTNLIISKMYHNLNLKHNINIYPLIVEAKKTKQGPSMAFTSGSGIAAASSITTNSA